MIVIDQKRCKGCVLCVDACPRSLIAQGKELNDQGYQFVVFTDPEGPGEKRCNSCTLCAVMCPDMCIEVFRGEKAKEGKP